MSSEEIIRLRSELAQLQRAYESLEEELAANRERATIYEHLADIQKSFNDIFHASLQYIPLGDALNKILDIIMDISWLAVEKQTCIFLVDADNPDQLQLTTHSNLDDSLLKMCDKVPFGHCLCGKAAQSRQSIFKASIDEDHENLPAGIKPHGHYIVPILAGDNILGVLNLYVKHGHHPDPLEEQYLQSIAGILSGIIKTKQYEQRLADLSFEDELTGLPNRRLFAKQLERALQSAKRTLGKVTLLYLDLDRFKQVNDTHGHEMGDKLLKQVSKRLKSCLREMDTLARIGGDEFMVLLEMIEAQEEVLRLKERITQAIREPFFINGERIEIDISVGVSSYPVDGKSYEELTRKADRAMYNVKAARVR